ncbi:hypothetical protein EHE19_001500 [Ruminiclostridium herbifermentans]|uniref:Uncharacterized protein n=1 Tax=Ruminiclostridium herbifermentans TaxID=2488810 RepID=A0A4U7JBG4_9FIRM|nr:hypothetical protein [Ruminiclostridium herbifermentans]QNU67249.1 hypothetical protein EHE19_001500 [Ruminiclostridium herbifermentans]
MAIDLQNLTKIDLYCPFRHDYCVMECALFHKESAFSGHCSIFNTKDLLIIQRKTYDLLECINDNLQNINNS